jgi:predicted nucleic acid-binding protein
MELDQGEAEAIILAKESSAEFLLMDETLGRNIAGARGLPVIGLVGVFLLAKKRALIQEVRPWIEQVEQEAGFYLSEAVKAKAYAAAGELGT